MTTHHLAIQRDRKLEPLQGSNLVRFPVQTKQTWYFKPKVVVFLFMAVGGITAFFIGALSL
jgi:hypothetical protein